jgi:hypothetical protein
VPELKLVREKLEVQPAVSFAEFYRGRYAAAAWSATRQGHSRRGKAGSLEEVTSFHAIKLAKNVIKTVNSGSIKM